MVQGKKTINTYTQEKVEKSDGQNVNNWQIGVKQYEIFVLFLQLFCKFKLHPDKDQIFLLKKKTVKKTVLPFNQQVILKFFIYFPGYALFSFISIFIS